MKDKPARVIASSDTPASELTHLVAQIAAIIEQARGHVRQSVNGAMVASYWEIGRLIVEHEQQGKARAAYGQRQLGELSSRLTTLMGKGFDISNLRNMRRFHLAFPIQETVSPELSWSHYNVLTKVENPVARRCGICGGGGLSIESSPMARLCATIRPQPRVVMPREEFLVEWVIWGVEMIAPNCTTALVYVGMVVFSLAGIIFCQLMAAKVLLGLLMGYGIACFILTKSWRAFAALFITKPDGTNSRNKGSPRM